MSNVVCIVQARMGSTRLTGKVMLKLCNYTVLYHVLNRIKQSRKIDKIIVATALIGVFVFNQKIDVPAMTGIAFIVTGVIIINMFSKTSGH